MANGTTTRVTHSGIMIPLPKPRRSIQNNPDPPVPLPRIVTLVKLRRANSHRTPVPGIVISRNKLQKLITQSCFEFDGQQSYQSDKEENSQPSASEMTARAIAASKQRDARPLSAYGEISTMASMSSRELIRRDHLIAASCSNLDLTRLHDTVIVEVEDITSDEQDSNGDTSTETLLADRDAEKMRSNPIAEWAVPTEYMSSPIVDALSKTIEDRPLPTTNLLRVSKSSSDSQQEGRLLDQPVSLLERIIRTRTIWFLPHLSRPQATHYLRIMDPGNFIVRSSTRENCMAMTVKLPPGVDPDSDIGNYIIEKVPMAMISNHSADENVSTIVGSVVRIEGSRQTFESLPYLIHHYCMNRDELHTKLALPSVISTCQTTKQLQSIALMEQEFWTSEMSLSRTHSRGGRDSSHRRHGSTSEVSTSFLGPRSRTYDDAVTCFDGSQDMVDGVGCFGTFDSIFSHESAGLGSFKGTMKRPSSNRTPRRFITMHGDEVNAYQDDQESYGSCSTSSSHSPPTKHDRLEYSSGAIGRRSQSVRSPKTSSPAKDYQSSQTLSRGSRPRSFLRSLFSFGSHSTERSKKSEKAGSNIQLANCSQFTPWNKPPVTASRSAFEITSVPQKSVFGSTSKKNQEYTSTGNIFENDDNYSSPWREYDDRQMISGHGSPGGRSEQMKTFKPAPPARNRTSTSGLRRERSDLSEVAHNAAMRLANHNESSPGPRNHSTPLQHKPSLRSAMRPPQNASDPQVIKNCVEELRRKRLQSTTEMLGEDTTPTSSTLDLNKKCAEIRPTSTASPNVLMRRRANWMTEPLGREHRLSVPNLAAPIHEFVVNGDVEQSARALKERMGRNRDGELMMCNEGLVTPVVRRKNFTAVDQDFMNGNNSSGHSAPMKATVPVVAVQRKTQNATSNESELVWRRKKPAEVTEKQVIKPSWSAINVELKNRQQKIAKVRPTPQLRTAHQRGTMDTISSSTSTRSSDYARICDMAGPAADRHSKLEDDNISVAGTVFNEPWDSNVWENLLDLAHHGDESQNRMNRTIHEEDDDESDDSDMTACGSGSADDEAVHMTRGSLQRRPRGISSASSSRMDDSDEDLDMRTSTWKSTMSQKRPLPSDKVTVKAWEQDSENISRFSTLDSRRLQGESYSSLPRTLTRRLHGAVSIDSLDDMAPNLPSMSPLLKNRFNNNNFHVEEEEEEDTRHHVGYAIQNYVERLAEVQTGANACFGKTVSKFIDCTMQTREADPAVMVRNIRQFINGMKNYLVKHGEGDLHAVILEESERLDSDQIVNVDAVLEVVLHKLCLKKLRNTLYDVFVAETKRAGYWQIILSNFKIIKNMGIRQLGFAHPQSVIEPSQELMREVSVYMRKMVKHYSPLKKLENFMKAVTLVISVQPSQRDENADPVSTTRHIPNADDLVRWIVFILAKTWTVGCDIEAWYMWELLPQTIFSQSDATYYLTALFSAIHILKDKEAVTTLSDSETSMIEIMPTRACVSPQYISTLGRSGKATETAFVKVAIADETVGSMRYATFPGVPKMSADTLAKVIAQQQGITTPEDYGLYLIFVGQDLPLEPQQCPITLKEQMKKEKRPHLLAYKRHGAKIAFPLSEINLL